jgi:hypothetical protein
MKPSLSMPVRGVLKLRFDSTGDCYQSDVRLVVVVV